ncbi:hypothetical protein [Amycolatopsis sp. La24]|uniref:hypothetical protein n=1 Tax=Amycolatopsis sp. La24 TaxID=3028304 RepID=UPI0023AF9AC8|nr:hypothetical protein [Amycolatopsis sp. La24]
MNPTDDEIARRVEENDRPLTAKRADIATRVAELAQRRAEAVRQLSEVDDKLASALAESRGIISIDELAEFTDVPGDSLARWQGAEKPVRARRKRSTGRTNRPRNPGSPAPESEPARAQGLPDAPAVKALQLNGAEVPR